MKQLLFLTTFLFFTIISNAQQWEVKKYTYDSMLNVNYGTATTFNQETETLNMDIYLPNCDDATHTSRRPLLVWFHGGAFIAGNKDDQSIQRLCKAFAQRGYVTASVNYRKGFVSDDNQWSCNYPNYECVFATDSAEWIRAAYRGVQDGKGALRYLINKHSQFRIDTNNVFVAGESAGSFISLGVALLDTSIERPIETFAINNVPKPSPNTITNCIYNSGKTFGLSIPRPDLGGIDGTIEPTTIKYTIKGIGNNYGAMLNDLLKYQKSGNIKPAIYQFHQPCDLVVPFDSGKIMGLLSWCFTNGYNCYAVANTPKVYGSKRISEWNTLNNYGYTIQNEFTSTTFPFNFLFGPGSCSDQINSPCHAYDNSIVRETNLAKFFAGLVTTNPICDTAQVLNFNEYQNYLNQLKISPNPVENKIEINLIKDLPYSLKICNAFGQVLKSIQFQGSKLSIDATEFSKGVYFILVSDNNGNLLSQKFIKN